MAGERVLALVSPAVGPARALWRLLDHGLTLVGCWHRNAHEGWEVDAWLARHNPAFSVTAALAEAGITRRQVPRLGGWKEAATQLDVLAPDLLLSAHFGGLVPASLLDRLPGRAVNLHPALLPAYRGPAAHVAMLADGTGDTCAGVTLHLMDSGFDTGPILHQLPVPPRPGEDFHAWEIRQAGSYAALIDEGLLPYLAGTLQPRAQPAEAGNYARLNWSDLDLTAAMPLDRAKRIAAVFGRSRDLYFRDGTRRWRLQPPVRHLGPATGAPPRQGWLFFEADLLDARVRLLRRITGHGRRLRRRHRRALRRARP